MIKKAKTNMENQISKFEESMHTLNIKELILQFLQPKERINILFLNKSIREQVKQNKVHNPRISELLKNFKKYKNKFKSNICQGDKHCEKLCAINNHNKNCKFDNTMKMLSNGYDRTSLKCNDCKKNFCRKCKVDNLQMLISNICYVCNMKFCKKHNKIIEIKRHIRLCEKKLNLQNINIPTLCLECYSTYKVEDIDNLDYLKCIGVNSFLQNSIINMVNPQINNNLEKINESVYISIEKDSENENLFSSANLLRDTIRVDDQVRLPDALCKACKGIIEISKGCNCGIDIGSC